MGEEVQDISQKFSLAMLKNELAAWKAHVEKSGLSDRLRFVQWLSEALGPQELALALDSEVERPGLWNTYLSERYGSASP